MVKALLPLQRADGFWNASLRDSTHFGGKELSGTALFAYGMAWGINVTVTCSALCYLALIPVARSLMAQAPRPV